MSETRSIPSEVRRRLRQEAFFGCAVCGEPVLDYHHIVPWAEKKHNDHEHMVAVCPTHHRIIGKMSRSKQYEIKRNPKNKRSDKLKGLLTTDRIQSSFKMGSNTFVNTPTILSYYGNPMITFQIMDGQNVLSAYIPRIDFWPEIKIDQNDVLVWSEGIWDLEFRTNYMKMVRTTGNGFFEIDLRQEEALVRGNLTIGSDVLTFDEKKTNIGTSTVSNCRFENCVAGITVGNPKTRLLLPNYAMATPKAVFVQLK